MDAKRFYGFHIRLDGFVGYPRYRLRNEKTVEEIEGRRKLEVGSQTLEVAILKSYCSNLSTKY